MFSRESAGLALFTFFPWRYKMKLNILNDNGGHIMRRLYVKLKEGEHVLFWTGLAFAMSILLLWIAFACYGVFPFGTRQLLVQDAWHQYYPFMMDLRAKLISGDSLLYTWNNGMGTNFLALAAYYLASPLNLLMPLFPEQHLHLFYSLAVSVKLGLASAFAAFALQKAFRRSDPSAAAFGMCYGLCAFFMGYYWNIMWMDTAALLPLVALGVVSLVREGKYKLYVVTITLSLICNFLMGLYVCLFTFFFFFVACFCCRIGWKTFGKRFLQIAFFTLIAIAMTEFLLLPVLAALQNTYGISNDAPEWKLKESFVEVFGNFAAFGGPTDREGLPNLYTGLPCVLLAALYVVSERVPKRQKACALGLLVLLILSLNISVIEYVWNGFHTTNMLPYRFSFLVSFVLAAMAFSVLPELFDEMPVWKYVLLAGTGAVLLTLCWFTHGTAVTLANAGVIAAYVGAAFLLRNQKAYMALALCLLLTGEMVANVIVGVDTVRTTTMNGFPEYRSEVKELLEAVESRDSGLYRVESVPKQSLNDPSLLGYPGVSTFSSLANVGVTRAIEKLGISSWPAGNRYVHNQVATPVANAFLGLKYLITKNRPAEDVLYLQEIASTEQCYAYENTAALPLGFMTDSAMAGKISGKNPFAVQNALFSAASGETGDVFEVIDMIHVGHKNLKVLRNSLGNYTYTLEDKAEDGIMKFNYELPRDGQVYVYIDCEEAENLEILHGDSTVKYTMSAKPDVQCAGYYREGDIVSFRWNVGKEVDDKSKMKIYVALLNESVFAQGIQRLADEPLHITDYSASHIVGTIEVKEPGYFYTSIPYEQGWTVYVDGEEAEVTPWQEAFIALEDVQPGTHTIEMTYRPAGLKTGGWISLGGLAMFLAVIGLERKYFKK